MKNSKSILVVSNPQKGEHLWHCWNADESFYVFTQRGVIGSTHAAQQLNKERKIYMSITYSAPKNRITQYFS